MAGKTELNKVATSWNFRNNTSLSAAYDNVHFQNSIAFVDALIKANKDYQTLYYPNRNHGIAGDNTRLHLYRQMTNFVLQNL